jgi:hypothetical protein
VTPSNVHSRTTRANRSHRAQSKSQHLINDSGINIKESLIAYDPRMPPPPVPAADSSAQPTSNKEKRRSKPLFGLAVPPWSRPTSPRNEDIPAFSLPPQSPPSRPSKVSKIESWFKIGALNLILARYFLSLIPEPTLGYLCCRPAICSCIVPSTNCRPTTAPAHGTPADS